MPQHGEGREDAGEAVVDGAAVSVTRGEASTAVGDIDAAADAGPDADELFADPDFPVDDSLLTEDTPKDVVEWRRPYELCDEPQLFVEGASRLDIVQGAVGDCWSMAACAALAENPHLVKTVVPDGQILHGPGYSGRIIIRLWHMGSWRDVEIDDRLPVISDELIYARCCVKNEFWIPLVEKALAKFHGGYNQLCGGQLPEGFVNLTGYSVRNIFIEDYKEKKNKLFYLLNTELKNKSLVACSRGGDFERGLPNFHGYTVTGVFRLQTDSHRVRLVRLRNPWGDDEWNGKWRDDHDVWKELGPEFWEKMGFQVRKDGEFWMKLVDFIKYFHELCVASRLPSVHEYEILPATHAKSVRRAWAEDNAGGPWGTKEFFTNPQFLLDIEPVTQEEMNAANTTQEEEDCDSEEEGNTKENAKSALDTCQNNVTCSEEGLPVLVELLQDHNRRVTTNLSVIGFHIFEVTGTAHHSPPEGRRWTDLQLEHQRHLVDGEPSEQLSAVRGYVHLQPGTKYVVIPCTKQPGEQRRFLLRVYAQHCHIHLNELH